MISFEIYYKSLKMAFNVAQDAKLHTNDQFSNLYIYRFRFKNEREFVGTNE